MKHIYCISQVFILLLLMLPIHSWSSEYDSTNTKISLLTCGPGKEVYTLYGHTAIRIQSGGEDWVVNYGAFSFKQEWFILRFVFGKTDYFMTIEPTPLFKEQYEEEKRWVVEQELNLTPKEKEKIIEALQTNYLPGNRTYRYNFFYNNCTTKARDIIINQLETNIIYRQQQKEYPSFRALIHDWTQNYPWVEFGNDLLLGINADSRTNHSQQEFLPIRLERDFAQARRKDNDKPLVVRTDTLLSASSQSGNTNKVLLTPYTCLSIFAFIILCITFLEWKLQKTWWILDFVWLTADGLAGLILFVMIFSSHPAVSINLQILLLNPLSLFFAWKAAKSRTYNKIHWYLKVYTIMITLCYLGSFLQTYAEGIIILALTLLFRNIFILKTHE